MPTAAIHTVILDMDGVITGERCYWDAAGMTVLELLASPAYLGVLDLRLDADGDTLLAAARECISDAFIRQVKSRAISTNWDLAHLGAALAITDLLDQAALRGPAGEAVSPDALRRLGEGVKLFGRLPRYTLDPVAMAFFDACLGKLGLDYPDAVNRFLEQRVGDAPFAFARGDAFWTLCQEIFQQCYLGDDLYGLEPMPAAWKRGLIHDEQPLLPLGEVEAALKELTGRGITLGIATGRPLAEIMEPLRQWNLLDYFTPDRIATHAAAEAAEQELREQGIDAQLSKPHPFLFLRAILPQASNADLAEERYPEGSTDGVAIVGDTPADIVAGRRIGCTTIAVLTGVAGADARAEFEALGTESIIDTVAALPSVLSEVNG